MICGVQRNQYAQAYFGFPLLPCPSKRAQYSVGILLFVLQQLEVIHDTNNVRWMPELFQNMV